MAGIKAYYQITISDTKTGKIIRRTHKRLSRSFVIQFLQMLQCHMEHAYSGTNTHAITDTSNTSRTIGINAGTVSYHNQNHWAVDAPEDVDTYGIVVGSDNTAEANTQYTLITKIADGTAAGQLDYGAHVWTDTQVVGANVDLQIQRPFINNSGGNVTVEECGIYIAAADTSATQRIFCIIRDITGTVTVADGQTLTVDYTLRTTV